MLAVRLLVVGALLIACGDDSGGPPRSSVTMVKVDTPPAGGDFTGVEVEADGTLVVILEGKLARIAPGETTPVVFADSATYRFISLSPDGDLYAATATELHTFAAGTITPAVVPIDPSGPLIANGRVEDAHFTFGPSGQVVVSLLSNFPRSYAYRSVDRGVTWTPVELPGGAPYLYAGNLVIAADGTLFATDPFNFFRRNDGQSWETLPPPAPNVLGKLHVAANGDILHYGVGAGGLLVSKNRGASFTSLAQYNHDPFFRSIDEPVPGRLVALANFSLHSGVQQYGPAYVIESTDGGATWRDLLYVRAHDIGARGDTIAAGRVGYSLSQTPEQGGLDRSTDAGATWEPLGTGDAPHETVYGVEFDGAGQVLARIENSLYRRVDGAWRSVAGVGGPDMKLGSNRGGVVAMSAIGFVLFSADDGASWTHTQNRYADYVPGGGIPGVPFVHCPRTRSDCLVSLVEAFPAPYIAGNGVLYRIDATTDTRLLQTNTIKMVEQPDGDLYATAVNFDAYLESTDGGTTWTEVPFGSALAFDSAGYYFSITTTGYAMTASTSTTPQPFELDGFDLSASSIRSVRFSADDRLFILTTQGLFESTTPVR